MLKKSNDYFLALYFLIIGYSFLLVAWQNEKTYTNFQ